MKRQRTWKDGRKIRRYKREYEQRLAELTAKLNSLFQQLDTPALRD